MVHLAVHIAGAGPQTLYRQSHVGSISCVDESFEPVCMPYGVGPGMRGARGSDSDFRGNTFRFTVRRLGFSIFRILGSF